MNGPVSALPHIDLSRWWPLPDELALRDALIGAYDAPERGYHNLLHISEVLERIDELSREIEFDTTSVRLAAWFHDAVHDTAPEPERRSAEWAARALSGSEVGVDEVVRLILLTIDHSVADGDVNGAVLCDADLAILAAPRARYNDYAAGVRREYAVFTDAEFAAGRSLVLRALVDAEHLFSTEHARRHWESTARANVARELVSLDSAASADAARRRADD